ncbi:MAG: energy transducer TonB [Pyrinomonadaceae bacterium]
MKTLSTIFVLVLLTASAAAQGGRQETPNLTCDGPAYKSSEVSRPATFTSRPQPILSEEALANSVRGLVVLRGVLCRSGRVSDIEVIEGLPFGVTERAIEAARRTEFIPAMKDGRTVSQAITYEFRFSYLGERGPLAQEPLKGRLIESIEIEGFREDLGKNTRERLKTRTGQPYNAEQIELDWQILLKLGNFDQEASTLRVEEGERGGLVVVFQLKERL